MTEREFIRILGWPGYKVYRHEIDEGKRTLRLWVRRTLGNKVLICGNCGGRAQRVEEVREREIRDLPWRKYQTWLIVEYYRVNCAKCGLRTKRVDQMPGKAPFSKDFEDEVGLASESAPARQVARRFQLAASTLRTIELRYLERWSKARKRPVVRQFGVEEIYLGKRQKFLTVVSDLATAEPLWFGPDQKEATLYEFFAKELSAMQWDGFRRRCVDMWEPFAKSILKWVSAGKILTSST